MIWAAMLLSVSGFGWYLLLTSNSPVDAPGFLGALLMLIFVAIVPALISFALNQRLLASNPLVIKIIFINILEYLVYSGIIAFGSRLISDQFIGKSLGLYFIWQIIFCLIGTLYALFSALAVVQPSNIRAAEISLAVVIPAVFLLTSNGFSAYLIMMVIVFWFIAFTVTLAVEGRKSGEGSEFRLEPVFFHALISVSLAIICFIIAFYGQMDLLLEKLRQGLVLLWKLLLRFLDWLFSKTAPPEISNNKIPDFALRPEEQLVVQESPTFILIITVIISIIILIFLLFELIKFLKMRLKPRQFAAGQGYSFIKSLAQMAKYLFSIIRLLFQEGYKAWKFIKTLAARLIRKLCLLLSEWLPARTPYQKVFRTYKAFLRWAGKYGLFRKLGETPLEFACRLEKSSRINPCPREEIIELTEIFLLAHYGHRPVSREQGERSQALLKKIRKGKKINP